MHVFGLAILFGLGIMAVARWVEYPLAVLRGKIKVSVQPVLEVALGIIFAWIVNFNLWQLWNVPMRAQWVAVTLTGIALGGISHVFTVTLGMLSGLGRKLNDEAETIESPANLQRVA